MSWGDEKYHRVATAILLSSDYKVIELLTYVEYLAFTFLHIDFQRIARQGEANAQILYKRNISRNRFEQFLRR